MPALQAISFATRGAYEQESERLAASCARWNVPLVREIVSPIGDWKANCAWKPKFIAKMMAEFPTIPLLWLDADAEVMGDISSLASIDCDLAVRTCSWPNPQDPHILSGTILIQPTYGAKAVIELWCNLQQIKRQTDQRVLEQATLQMPPDFRLHDLDAKYVAIFDETPAIDQPLIVHHQASRRLRRLTAAAARA